jgi:hypothetical protein
MALFATLFLLWFGRDPGFIPGYTALFKNGYKRQWDKLSMTFWPFLVLLSK